MTAITREEKLRCAQRELAMRERVYPRLIANGRMTKEEASRELDAMRSIAADYQQELV